MITPIILAGGSGTRLWPLSRGSYPKQFLNFFGDKSLFQNTLRRVKNSKIFTLPIVICNDDYRFIVAQQCHEIGIDNPKIILEPVGRNTAPALSVALASHDDKSDNGLYLVLSSDHFIDDDKKFIESIEDAILPSSEGKIVTFGAKPTAPNVNYGYIECKNSLGKYLEVKKFTEKPSLEIAKKFIKKENYYWNCGIFMFSKEAFVNEINKHNSEIYKLSRKAYKNSTVDLDFIRLDQEVFQSIENISFDNAVLEKSRNISMVQIKSKWHDLGTWDSIYELSHKDSSGNAIEGSAFIEKSHNCHIISNEKLIVGFGLENLHIISTDDVVMIAKMGSLEREAFNKIFRKLKQESRKEKDFGTKIFRPWGWFKIILTGKNFQVKTLNINPKSKLSLQTHEFRSEHWVVVDGSAKVFKGDVMLNLEVGDSVFIPKQVKHSIENNSDDNLEIIEVQSGSYLGEDDIVRYEDIYNRLNS